MAIVKNNGSLTEEKVVMVDSFGNTREVTKSVLVADILASDQYEANLRKYKCGDWNPAKYAAADSLVVTGANIYKQIHIKGISVFINGTVVATTSQVAIEDAFGTVYWESAISTGNSNFDFGPDGLKLRKPDADTIESYGDFVVKIVGVTGGTNSISIEGWRV